MYIKNFFVIIFLLAVNGSLVHAKECDDNDDCLSNCCKMGRCIPTSIASDTMCTDE